MRSSKLLKHVQASCNLLESNLLDNTGAYSFVYRVSLGGGGGWLLYTAFFTKEIINFYLDIIIYSINFVPTIWSFFPFGKITSY